MSSLRRSSSKIRKLLWNYLEDFKNYRNEVNCMNDSKDFRDAESVRSGNSHVTSQPGVFPKHPPCEGLLRPAFISQRQTEEPPNTWDTSGTSGNVLHIHRLLHQLRILKNLIPLGRKLSKNQFTCLQRRKVEDQNETQI